MKRKISLCMTLVIAFCAAAVAQEERTVHPASRHEMEQEMLKHRKDVLKALLTVPQQETPFDYVNFGIQGPTVVLVGFTIRPVLKSDFERAVKRLHWVRNVVNEVVVLPLNPADRSIRANSLAILERLLPQSFGGNHANIRIKSLRREVTLVGYIDEFQKKQFEAALVRVEHVSLVKKVTNDVAVKSKSHH